METTTKTMYVSRVSMLEAAEIFCRHIRENFPGLEAVTTFCVENRAVIEARLKGTYLAQTIGQVTLAPRSDGIPEFELVDRHGCFAREMDNTIGAYARVHLNLTWTK